MLKIKYEHWKFWAERKTRVSWFHPEDSSRIMVSIDSLIPSTNSVERNYLLSPMANTVSNAISTLKLVRKNGSVVAYMRIQVRLNDYPQKVVFYRRILRKLDRKRVDRTPVYVEFTVNTENK